MTAAAKPTVLVVDDEPQVLVALEDLLGPEYVVLKSTSPEQALRLVANEREIAVILSDQRMPQMSGDELFARVRTMSRASRVLVTGYADLDAVVNAVNEGRIFAYVDKPWDVDRLRLLVGKAAEHFRLEQELRLSEERLRLMVAATGAGLFDWDMKSGVVHYSDGFAALLGEAAGAITPTIASLLQRLHPADGDATLQRLDAQRDERAPPAILECRLQRADGEYQWFALSASGVRSPGGERARVVGAIHDVSARRAQQERSERLSRVRALSSAVHASLLRLNDPRVLLFEACSAGVREAGFALALALWQEHDAEPVPVACESLDPALLVEMPSLFTWEAIRADGEVLDSLTAGLPFVMNEVGAGDTVTGTQFARHGRGSFAAFPLRVSDGLRGVFVLVSREPNFFDSHAVTLLSQLASNLAFALEHEAKSQRLSFVLSHDPLTGLARRELFVDRLQQRLAACQAGQPHLAVFWVDISRFRQVNEAFGRSGGDALLVQVGKRLTDAIGGDVDGVARLDANAFGVITRALITEAESAGLLDAIISALHCPVDLGQTELRIAVSVGVALYPTDGDTAEVLLSHCETAGKVAKAQGQPYLFYAARMNRSVSERLQLENKLRRAVERQEFVLHYQPKVDIGSGRVNGFEALLRWNDPEAGLVPPSSFVPLLEETGLILPVGAWVLEEAARQYHAWHERGIAPPRIAVNVSAIQLADAAFLGSIERVVELYPRASAGIDLEITESVLMGELSPNVEKLQAARGLGFEVALDDFGTGYSSLGYLNRLPLDAIKIDRAFVDRMDQNAQEMSLVMTIISLGHSLGLDVVAEGVETKIQARLLALLRCDQLQGYLISRPLPASEAVTVLERTHSFMSRSAS